MIASVRGTLLDRGDGWCIVEAGGVGYLVQVSIPTLATLPSDGEPVRLLTRHVVREDAQLLFGFAEANELKLFDLLIGVSGVGPKIALAALSGLAPAALARAIRDGNLAAIVAVPGIGRKTAERLVVDLRDKLDFLAAGAPAPAKGRANGAVPRDERLEDAIEALVTLGWTKAQAAEAVQAANEEAPESRLEELVKRAIARLGRAAMGAGAR
jgi:Holliday junction DNA helicase RuvA